MLITIDFLMVKLVHFTMARYIEISRILKGHMFFKMKIGRFVNITIIPGILLTLCPDN